MSKTTSPGDALRGRAGAGVAAHDAGAGVGVTVQRTSSAPDADRWSSLLGRSRAGNAFIGPGWVASWARAFLPGDGWRGPLTFLCANAADGSLVGLMPLARQGRHGVSLMAVPGYYMPFRDLLVDTAQAAAVADALVAALRRCGGVGLRLGPVERSSSGYAAMRQALDDRRWTLLEIERGDQLVLTLPADESAYWPTVRGRAKKAEYFRRRLEKQGAVRVERSTGLAAADWTRVYDDLVAVESRSWVAARGEPRFIGDANRAFWHGVFADPASSAALSVWILHLDDVAVSFCLTLDSGPVRYQLVNGYADDVRQHSTGYVVFLEMIRDAYARGVERICFGQGDPGHKGEWGAVPSETLVDLVALKPGLLGRAAVGAYRRLQRWRDRR